MATAAKTRQPADEYWLVRDGRLTWKRSNISEALALAKIFIDDGGDPTIEKVVTRITTYRYKYNDLVKGGP